MLKRINWKAVFYVFTWVICLSGLVVLMSFIESRKTTTTCKSVKVIIPGNQNFIERAEVDGILMMNGGPLVGRELKNINIHKLEAALKANPFIEFAKVYADMDGIIQVQIRQREPLLRVLNMQNQDFYVDYNGYKIPTSDNFTADVLVANGYIAENFNGTVDTLKSKIAKDLFLAANFISRDTLWSDQIEQLYVNENNEIELVPRVGDQKIILGNADSLKVKFRNLYAFYKKALPKLGWNTYKTINIKYANQIVCEKNIIDSTKLIKPIAKESVALALKPDTAIKESQDTIKINAF
ncbi:MAG: cell division protein FtsQ [Daejeonella sp.]